MTIQELKQQLENRFPGIKICGSAAEFDEDNNAEGLWVSGEEGTHKGMPIFDYYVEDFKETTYTLGILNEVYEFLSNNNFFAEAQDPGTYMIWRV